jgi:hypothetical protein
MAGEYRQADSLQYPRTHTYNFTAYPLQSIVAGNVRERLRLLRDQSKGTDAIAKQDQQWCLTAGRASWHHSNLGEPSQVGIPVPVLLPLVPETVAGHPSSTTIPQQFQQQAVDARHSSTGRDFQGPFHVA